MHSKIMSFQVGYVFFFFIYLTQAGNGPQEQLELKPPSARQGSVHLCIISQCKNATTNNSTKICNRGLTTYNYTKQKSSKTGKTFRQPMFNFVTRPSALGMSDPRCDLLESVGEGYRVSRKCTLHIYGIAMTSYCAPPLSHQRLQNMRLIFRTAQFHYIEKKL